MQLNLSFNFINLKIKYHYQFSRTLFILENIYTKGLEN